MKNDTTPRRHPDSADHQQAGRWPRFHYVSVPNGWDDARKLTNKVLTYQDRQYTWTGWNSDTNEAFFACPINQDPMVATITKARS